MHEVDTRIFLGSVHASTSEQMLQKAKISHIIVVHPSLAMTWPEKYAYHRVPIDDTPMSNLLELLPSVLNFFEEAMQQKGKVLVHCSRGISRSTSIVIAYLMLQKGLAYTAARLQVSQRRSVAYPNLGFEAQLLHMESLLSRCSARSTREKIEWLAGTLPKGDLDAVACPFKVREAMNQPIRFQFNEVHALGEQLLNNPPLAEQRKPWTTYGRFFEALQKYRTIPEDSKLVDLAVSVTERLRRSVRLLDEGPASVLAGIQACLDLAGEIERWIEIARSAFKATAIVVEAKNEKTTGPLVTYASDSSSEDEREKHLVARNGKKQRCTEP